MQQCITDMETKVSPGKASILKVRDRDMLSQMAIFHSFLLQSNILFYVYNIDFIYSSIEGHTWLFMTQYEQTPTYHGGEI